MRTIISIISRGILLMLSIALIGACTTDPVTVENEISTIDLQLESVETTEDQLKLLTREMRKFRNLHVAEKNGYTVQVSPYIPGMGIHVLNPEYVNGEFNLLKPELLVYYNDKHGKWILGAAEYLVPLEDCDPENPTSLAPDGFIGDTDHWHINCIAGGWTLHAWVGLENEEGVFNPINNAVPPEVN
jgi:hypothetical protein